MVQLKLCEKVILVQLKLARRRSLFCGSKQAYTRPLPKWRFAWKSNVQYKLACKRSHRQTKDVTQSLHKRRPNAQTKDVNQTCIRRRPHSQTKDACIRSLLCESKEIFQKVIGFWIKGKLQEAIALCLLVTKEVLALWIEGKRREGTCLLNRRNAAGGHCQVHQKPTCKGSLV